jgi:hypothetical protein
MEEIETEYMLAKSEGKRNPDQNGDDVVIKPDMRIFRTVQLGK